MAPIAAIRQGGDEKLKKPLRFSLIGVGKRLGISGELAANAMYLSASMTFSKDLLKQFIPDLSDKKMVLASRIFVWVVIAIGYIVIAYQPSIMKWILIGYASISCLVLPLYGGLVTKKATPASGKWSLALSITGVIVWEVLGSPWDINSLFIALSLGVVGFIAGIFNKKGVTPEAQHHEMDYDRLYKHYLPGSSTVHHRCDHLGDTWFTLEY